MYGPTAGGQVVAINAASGAEIWRFNAPAEQTAMRGLTYHDGRVIFAAGMRCGRRCEARQAG